MEGKIPSQACRHSQQIRSTGQGSFSDDARPPGHFSKNFIMHWLYLGMAVIFEILVAISAGKAAGFTRIGWTTSTLIAGAIATYFLSLAMLTFDVGVGYAIWTSVAGVGIVILGALFFGQRLNWGKFFGIALVIGGVVGLRLSGAA